MAQDNNIAQQLNDLLVTRGYDPELRDAAGNDGCEPKDAKLFKIDYTAASGKNYGTMVIILDVGNDLKAMFGNNLGRGMEDQDKNEWFEFQQQLSQFANAHRWTYTGDDISKLKYTMQGLAAIKEGLFEGYYGTRRISYAGEPTEARLMIRHNRNLGENDARFRYVESIFVETADGERYRLPFVNLAGGRAMLEHVRQGGKPYDVRGNHICEMITELKVLARFNRASQGRVLEGVKQGVVEGAQIYYKSLRESIKRLSGPRGYSAYFESWHPADITEQDQLVEDIKTLFVEQTIDNRIEQALPLLAKIQRGREMKEADIFENWMNTLAEGTWSLPETPEQLNKLKELMSSELIVGPDGTNATEQLYDLVGDDLLFDRISELAAQDPRANLWDDSVVQARMQELGIQMPDRAEPDMDAQPQQAMAEAGFPGAPDVEMPPMEPSGDPQRDELKQEYMDLHREIKSLVDLQYNSKSNEEKMQAKARIKQLNDRADEIYAILEPRQPPNEWQKKKYGFDDNWNKVNQGMAEADNIAAFESLRRMASLAGVPLAENALNDSGSTLGHIIQTYQEDVRDFIKHGSMSDHLYDELYDYYFDAMPYGVKKARTGDPHEWIGDRFYDDMQGHPIVDECLGGIVGEAMVDEAQPQSEIMRRNPKGFPVTATPLASPDARRVGALDLTGQQSMPQQDYIYKDNPIDALATVRQNAGILTPAVPTATSKSDPFSMLSPSLQAEITRDQQTQNQKDRIERMRQDMPDTTPGNTTGASGYYDSNGVLRIDMSAGLEESAPLEECNYTMENEYCPVHGLKECWLEEMNLSILATGSRLIEDLDEDSAISGPPGGKVRAMGTKVFKRGPDTPGQYDGKAGYFAHPDFVDATRSAADNDRAKRISDWETQTGQDEPRLIGAQSRPIPPRTPTPRTSTAVAKPVPGAKITATDLPDEVDDQGRQYFQNYVIDTDGKQIPRIRVDGVGRTQDEPMDEGGMPGMGAALRGAGELGGKAANAVKDMITKISPGHPDYPLLQAARNQEQGNMKVWNKRYPDTPWTSQSDTDLLKSFNHDQNVQKGFGQFQRDAMPNDYSPTGYTRAQKSKGAAIDAQNSMQGNQDLFKNAYGIDEADMMNPEIPKDFGSPEHLAHLAGLGKALQAGDRSALGKSNAALAAAQVGQGKTPWEPAPTPSFSTPGAAHDGQQGYDYQEEEPKGQAHSGQGGYNYYDYDDADQSSAETARLGRLRNPNVDPALAHMLINPNNPDAFAMQRDDEPDQSDAETARLGRAGASADSEFVHAPGEAGRSINYESREGDALLARIKSLAMLR